MPTLPKGSPPRTAPMTPAHAWSESRRQFTQQQLSPFQQYRANPTPRLRDALVAANLGLVEKAARRWAKSCKEPWEDLRQEGVFGLIKAVERFDPTTGYNFSSFAMPFISGAILHYLRDKGWGQVRPPRQAVEQYAKVTKARRRLLAAGRILSEVEVAQGLGIKPARWAFVKAAREQPAPVSLEYSELEIEHHDPDITAEPAILAHLAELPPLQYRCLVESVFGGLSTAQIAARTGRTPAEVQHQIDTATGVLREAHATARK